MTPPRQRPPVGARGTPNSSLAIHSHTVFPDREQARSYEKQKPVTRVGASLLAIHNHAKAQVREHARSCEEHNRDPISYRARRRA